MIPLKYRLLAGISTVSLVAAQDADQSVVSKLDEIVVTANRSGQSLFEQLQSGSSLEGRELLLKIEPTLGETLAREPGVSSTYFGPGASRPILRGLGDDRVRILQNGTSVLDVSNVSPDHAVASDPLTISSVEVVRGPATLLYGPNTIGGVVNVIDNRIAEQRFDQKYPSGKVDFSGGTADDLFRESGEINWGAGPLVFHLDAFHRNTENLKIPGFARSKALRLADPRADEAFGILPNSFADSEGAGFGASYIFENGYLGLSYSGINSTYGTVAEEDVTIGLDQRRWDLRGAVYNPTDWLREINFKLGYSDYSHTEFEGAEPGTLFEIEGYNGRLEFLHEAFGGFEGTFGYELQSSDFSALGAEAFLPPVGTDTNSLFFFEEKEIGKTRLQFGARYDRQSSETEANEAFGPSLNRDFNALSVSAGVVYNPVEDYALSFALAYTQRPPTYVELSADGPHLATNAIEIGDANLGKEHAFSVDLTLRKKAGRVTGSVGVFYNRFNDFISAQPTGEIDAVDGLPIFAYEAGNVDFYGGEAEATFHLLGAVEAASEADAKSGMVAVSGYDSRLDLTVGMDYVHAEDRDTNEPVPRIPPFRTRAELEYGVGPFTASVNGQYVAEQDRNADFELPTDSYFLLGAALSYQLSQGDIDTTFYVKGVNLTDDEARLSTSFLKDIAPLAGRGLVVGVRAEF